MSGTARSKCQDMPVKVADGELSHVVFDRILRGIGDQSAIVEELYSASASSIQTYMSHDQPSI
ncbi:hypothetical protein [Paenibacillus cymbidii]|uniref:hypothetical protein n=1 Tax=Paenibacillus cymbidii TaxID=1639034 RepID=UPI0010820B35|nr:hypothetical protein [Paenibacillus cymbidii]